MRDAGTEVTSHPVKDARSSRPEGGISRRKELAIGALFALSACSSSNASGPQATDASAQAADASSDVAEKADAPTCAMSLADFTGDPRGALYWPTWGRALACEPFGATHEISSVTCGGYRAAFHIENEDVTDVGYWLYDASGALVAVIDIMRAPGFGFECIAGPPSFVLPSDSCDAQWSSATLACVGADAGSDGGATDAHE